jgi:quercetin dioxygenase-like cupin family protein
MITKCLVLALGVAAVSADAAAQASDKEQPITWNADAKDLKWDECPPGLPKGCTLTVLQGDPEKNNSDVLVKFPPKSTIDPHMHSSAEHMILLSGQMTMEYEGQPKSMLKAGTYAYGPAKAPHKASCDSDVPCVLFINFDLPVDLLPVAPPKAQ